jgi:hypothetical protein
LRRADLIKIEEVGGVGASDNRKGGFGACI